MDYAPAISQPKRIVYLDALRALAILLVVFTLPTSLRARAVPWRTSYTAWTAWGCRCS